MTRARKTRTVQVIAIAALFAAMMTGCRSKPRKDVGTIEAPPPPGSATVYGQQDYAAPSPDAADAQPAATGPGWQSSGDYVPLPVVPIPGTQGSASATSPGTGSTYQPSNYAGSSAGTDMIAPQPMTTSGSRADTSSVSTGSSTRSIGATQPAAGGRSHVVARGETLWSIAARYYGDGSQWKRIADANRMADGNRLYVGQTLTIP